MSTDRKELPPIEYLNDCFNYDCETGVVTWNTRPRVHFASNRSCAVWNSRYAGLEVGSVGNNGYIYTSLDDDKYLLHRIIWKLHYGVDPIEFIIDHKNNDRTDNRACNLREATESKNSFNSKMSSANTSGTKGLSWDKRLCRWHAYITIDKKRYNLGLYSDKDEAIAVVNKFRTLLHEDFANFGKEFDALEKPMNDSAIKNHRDIMKALLSGKTLVNESADIKIHLYQNEVVIVDTSTSALSLITNAKEWLIYNHG